MPLLWDAQSWLVNGKNASLPTPFPLFRLSWRHLKWSKGVCCYSGMRSLVGRQWLEMLQDHMFPRSFVSYLEAELEISFLSIFYREKEMGKPVFRQNLGSSNDDKVTNLLPLPQENLPLFLPFLCRHFLSLTAKCVLLFFICGWANKWSRSSHLNGEPSSWICSYINMVMWCKYVFFPLLGDFFSCACKYTWSVLILM